MQTKQNDNNGCINELQRGILCCQAKKEEDLEDGRQREVVWEENRGTYNPAAFLMQFQASPWSSA